MSGFLLLAFRFHLKKLPLRLIMAHQVPEDGTLLPLMEEFYTIQGEGFNTGKAAYFIRLGGCDVGCVWCDVKESWDADKHPHRSIPDLVAEASAYPGRRSCLA